MFNRKCSKPWSSKFNQLMMSESTLSAWSHSIHLPRGGCGGGPIPEPLWFAVLFYVIGPCIWIHNFGVVWPVVFVYKSGWCARILNFRCFFLSGARIPPGAPRVQEYWLFDGFFWSGARFPPLRGYGCGIFFLAYVRRLRVMKDHFLGLRATIGSHEK